MSETKKERQRRHDAKRREEQPWRNWYKLKAWWMLRTRRFAANPFCKMCAQKGLVVSARIVDHIIPHRGDRELFFDYENTQSLCKHCHDSVKQAEEMRGYSVAVDEDGWPVDPAHPANKE